MIPKVGAYLLADIFRSLRMQRSKTSALRWVFSLL